MRHAVIVRIPTMNVILKDGPIFSEMIAVGMNRMTRQDVH